MDSLKNDVNESFYRIEKKKNRLTDTEKVNFSLLKGKSGIWKGEGFRSMG